MATAVLVACGDREDTGTAADSTMPARTTADTVAARTPAAPEVVAVTLGRGLDGNRRITQPADSFGVEDTVYAVVESRGAGHLDLKAVWRYEDGQVISDNARSIDPDGEAYTEFHVVKATPWPSGDYAVEILANGKSVDMQQFQIR
jgi:hypothetical protein